MGMGIVEVLLEVELVLEVFKSMVRLGIDNG
jgi:hypothetical protein